MISSADLTPEIEHQDTVYGLATAGNVVYAARQSGLYRSHDAGMTWHDAFANLPEVQSLTVTAVVSAGDSVFAGVKGAVICSQDGGETWAIAGLASPAPTVTAIAISPNFIEDGTAVVGTADDGVFVSTDRGASWVAWNFGLIDAHVLTLAFSPDYRSDKLLLAGTESGVFASKNGGRGWNEVDFPMAEAPVISLAFSATYAETGAIFAGTESSGLLVSHDQGGNWRQIEPTLISGAVNAMLVRAAPANELWLLLEDRVVHSSDNGRTWNATANSIVAGKLPLAMSLQPGDQAGLIVGFADGEIITTA